MIDRPWVKPDHHERCICSKCVPHVTHGRPELSRLDDFRYPCGLIVATTNALQDAQIAAGATHSQAYHEPITCPRCEGLELARRVQTSAR